MKKIFKIIGIFLTVIIGIYALFITEESIRIKNGGQTPLFILRDSGTCDGDKIERTGKIWKTNCKGLGYRIEREYILGGQTGETNDYVLMKEEFWLFDKFLLWGWIS